MTRTFSTGTPVPGARASRPSQVRTLAALDIGQGEIERVVGGHVAPPSLRAAHEQSSRDPAAGPVDEEVERPDQLWPVELAPDELAPEGRRHLDIDDVGRRDVVLGEAVGDGPPGRGAGDGMTMS